MFDIFCVSGSSTTRKPSTFARIHPGRSTTVAASGVAESMRVNSRTCPSASRDSLRSSRTACLASSRLT